jgi:transketolase
MIAMRDAWSASLVQLAASDPRILLLDGDLATSTKADKFADAYPARFLQMGIAEQNMVGVAAGLAAQGYIPWLSSFAVFFTHRALDQVRMSVAQTGANVKIAAGYAGLLTGFTGRTHQDVQDLAIMRAMPGMTVIAPADADECATAVSWANNYYGPVYLRLARNAGPAVLSVSDGSSPGDGELRPVRVLRQGDEVVLVSTGSQTARTVEAAELLLQAGISAAVVHVPFLKPVDRQALLAALSGRPLVVSVEEHSIIGGLGGLVAELIAEELPNTVLRRIGLNDVWGESAPDQFLLDKYGLSGPSVAETVQRIVTTALSGRM